MPDQTSRRNHSVAFGALLIASCFSGCDPNAKVEKAPTAPPSMSTPEAAGSDMTVPTGAEDAPNAADLPESADFRSGHMELEGVVTSVLMNRGELGGFFLQTTPSDSTDPTGFFVETSRVDVEVGDLIRVSGNLDEKSGMMTLSASNEDAPIVFTSLGQVDKPFRTKTVSFDHPINWERHEGTLVRIAHPMVVIDTYDIARRGRIVMAPEPLRVPTEEIDPNDKDAAGQTHRGSDNADSVAARDQLNLQLRLTLDDGVTSQNRFPIPLIPGLGSDVETLRVGSTIRDLTGVIYQTDGEHYLLPDGPLQIEFAPRPPRPDLGDADLVVASFNVLNYFTTLDDGSNGARGADSLQEQKRQTEKLVNAMIGLDADVIGLMELENNLESEQQIVDAINTKLGDNLFTACGLPEGFADAPGANQSIRSGLIYRKDRLSCPKPLSMLEDKAFYIARTPLSQTFALTENGFTFTVVVNHFKSKGSRNASGEDRDQGDGQSSFNAARRKQAQAIARYVQTLESAGEPNVLVIGDLNAYSQEDPIDTLRSAGLVDLTETACLDPSPFTYIFYGQAGCIDHSFATGALAEHVTALAPWNINSAEPRSLDYNTEYNPPGLFKPDAFRSSDHDPVLIGIKSHP